MNKDNQTKAEVLVKRAIYDLQEAATILKLEEQSDGFYILDLTQKMVIAEKPTFLTAKNFAIDYLEEHSYAKVGIARHESILNK